MVISMEQYASLRQEFLKVAKFHIKTRDLIELKIFYQVAINSVRTSDYINDIEDLVKILEKRGVVRYDNITPLKHIAIHYLGHSRIIDKLNEYDAWLRNYRPPHSQETNLYKVKNGECHLRKTNNNINKNIYSQLNSNREISNSINSSLRYNIPPLSTLRSIDNDDLSDSNNSAVSLSSFNNHRDDENSFIHIIDSIINHDDRDNQIKDCKARILSYQVNNDDAIDKKRGNLASNAAILPSNVIVESESNNISPESRYSPTEDFNRSDKVLPNTPLISRPRSIEPRTTVSSSVISGSLSAPCNSLRRLNSKDNLETVRYRINKFICRRCIKILIVILSGVIISSTLFIVYRFSKNSVHYYPEASAPIQEVYATGQPQTSSNPVPGYTSRFNLNGVGPPHHVTLPTSPPLQTLNEKEARLQQKVFEMVSKKLGSYWKDVARCLKVRECDINDIDKPDKNYEQKAYAVLKLFAAETNLDYWQRSLKKALVDCRRKDLSEDVEELLSRRF